jgi:tRNA-methyltransferase O
LTVVELLRRENLLLHVRGIDLLDGTPILDIKPYLSSVSPGVLRRGWLAEAEAQKGKKFSCHAFLLSPLRTTPHTVMPVGSAKLPG